MNNRVRAYYERELSALREQGKLFSQRFPKLAPFLGQGIKDPDIERLLEGFAFVGAKLTAKIEDAVPEVAEQFLNILAPGYFGITPSACILQFKPNPAMGKTSRFIPRCTEITASCQKEPFFLTTCYPVNIEPLELVSCTKKVRQGQTHLKFGFKTLYEHNSQDLTGPIRFYLQGDLRESYFLSYLLTQQLLKVSFNLGKEKHDLGNKVKLKRLGLHPAESLIPFYAESYHCFALLAEYFSFPEKFMLLELLGLDFKSLPSAKAFELEFVLDFDDRANLSVNIDNFQLHCVPAINLFKASAEPFLHQGEKIKIPLRVQNKKEAAIHSVVHVDGFAEEQRLQFEYLPARQFSVFDQSLNRYQSHLQESILQDHPEVYLELWSPQYALETQVISTEVLAYQPEAFLKVNGVQLLSAEKTNLGVEFNNLTPFSLPVYPPLSLEVVWQLIAHLSFKFKNLNNIEVLRQLILAYDFAGFQAGQHQALGKKLATHLLDIKTIAQQRFYRGEVFAGQHSILTLKEDGFLNIGEIHLFGSLLAEILQQHAPFNSYHELSIQGALTGVKFAWQVQFS